MSEMSEIHFGRTVDSEPFSMIRLVVGLSGWCEVEGEGSLI